MKYRILDAGEVIKQGDEVFENSPEDKRWTKSKVPGCFVLPKYQGDYRRPIPEKRKPTQTRRKQSLTRASILTSGRYVCSCFSDSKPVKVILNVRKGKLVGVSLAN